MCYKTGSCKKLHKPWVGRQPERRGISAHTEKRFPLSGVAGHDARPCRIPGLWADGQGDSYTTGCLQQAHLVHRGEESSEERKFPNLDISKKLRAMNQKFHKILICNPTSHKGSFHI